MSRAEKGGGLLIRQCWELYKSRSHSVDCCGSAMCKTDVKGLIVSVVQSAGVWGGWWCLAALTHSRVEGTYLTLIGVSVSLTRQSCRPQPSDNARPMAKRSALAYGPLALLIKGLRVTFVSTRPLRIGDTQRSKNQTSYAVNVVRMRSCRCAMPATPWAVPANTGPCRVGAWRRNNF